MTRTARLLSLLLLCALLAGRAAADVVVVVNSASGVPSLTRDEVVNIFLGRFRQLPSGVPAAPLDLPAEHPDRVQFYRLLVHKEPSEIRSYWARLVFSGRTMPPRVATGEDDLVTQVAGSRQAVGYLSAAPNDPRIRVVFRLREETGQ